jgi:uncharacterized metal-binding protein
MKPKTNRRNRIPQTKYHDVVSITISAGLLIASGAFGIPCLLISTAGALSGLLISPDWDWRGFVVEDKQDGRRYVISTRNSIKEYERIIRPVYGKVIRRWSGTGILYKWLTLYPQIFAHRRAGKRGLSHSVIGTLIRVMWLIFPVGVAFIAPDVFGWWLAGLFVADMVHLFLDWKF